MRRGVVLPGIFLLALVEGVPVQAADNAAITPGSEKATVVLSRPFVTLDVSNQPLIEAVKTVGDQSHLTILVEPNITDRVTAKISSQTVERALSQLTGENGPIWARVELVMKKDEALPQDPLFNMVRAMNALSVRSMTCRIGERGDTLTLSRDAAKASSQQGAGDNEKRVTLYVVAARSQPDGGIPNEGDAADRAITMRRRAKAESRVGVGY
jgi:hypothetical protein